MISIYPRYQKRKPTEIELLLDIYAGSNAYKAHWETPHFKKYKTQTLKRMRSLKLIDLNGIDEETMPIIFKKMN